MIYCNKHARVASQLEAFSRRELFESSKLLVHRKLSKEKSRDKYSYNNNNNNNSNNDGDTHQQRARLNSRNCAQLTSGQLQPNPRVSQAGNWPVILPIESATGLNPQVCLGRGRAKFNLETWRLAPVLGPVGTASSCEFAAAEVVFRPETCAPFDWRRAIEQLKRV